MAKKHHNQCDRSRSHAPLTPLRGARVGHYDLGGSATKTLAEFSVRVFLIRLRACWIGWLVRKGLKNCPRAHCAAMLIATAEARVRAERASSLSTVYCLLSTAYALLSNLL